MATTILKGRVEAVGPVTIVGENKTELQHMILFVPGYHDGFEQRGRDNTWCLQILGKKVDVLKATEAALKGKIIEVKCFLDSQYIAPKVDGQNGFYSINATVNSFEIVK